MGRTVNVHSELVHLAKINRQNIERFPLLSIISKFRADELKKKLLSFKVESKKTNKK